MEIKNFPPKEKILTNTSTLLEVAAQSIDTTDTQATMSEDAFRSYPLGLLSIIAARMPHITDTLYSAYFAFITNLFNIVTGELPLIKQDLVYITMINNNLSPKTISSKYGNKKFSWTEFSSIGLPANDFICRGQNYYFYKPVPVDPVGSPQTCVPMIADTISNSVQAYIDLLAFVTQKKNLLNIADVASVKTSNTDVSTFAASSVYVGAGSTTAGGLYSSAELELPGTSIPVLSQFCMFPQPTRVSAFLKNSSGDACMAGSLAFNKPIYMNHYKTVHPVRIKTLDFAEIFSIVSVWMAQAIQQVLVMGAEASNFPQIAMGAFIGALRQTLLNYFLTAQAGTQFLTYDPNGVLFEPFRMGANCVPKIGPGLMLPLPLIEQLRYLAPVVYENFNETNHNSKNAIIYLPCWGLSTMSTAFINQQYLVGPVPTNLFSTADGYEAINWIDGTMGNNVYNLNSQYFMGAITTWNGMVTRVAPTGGYVGILNGSAPCSTLPLTRIYNLTEAPTFAHLQKYPNWMDLPQGFTRRKIERQTSKGKTLKNEKEEEFEIVKIGDSGGDSILSRKVLTRVLSFTPISEELANIVQYIVLPSIITQDEGLDDEGLDYNKLMIMYREPHYIAMQTDNDVESSAQTAGSISQRLGALMAPGEAKPTYQEFDRVTAYLSEVGKGGFLAEILGGAASVVGVFGL